MPSKTDIQLEYDLIREHYVTSDKNRTNLANSFDKHILTFATGTLVLSVNSLQGMRLVKNIIYLLGLGWLSLIVSMLATLMSVYWSIKGYEETMDRDVKNVKRLNDGKETIRKPNRHNWLIDWFTKVGIGTFILGIVILATFYFINFKEGYIYGG